MSVRTLLEMSFRAIESQANKGGGNKTSSLVHETIQRAELANGTGTGQADLVWSDVLSLTTSPTDLDLNALTSELDGSTLNLAEAVAVIVVNQGTSGNVLVGGGTNPLGLFSDDSDIAVVGPGGWQLRYEPAGIAVGASDILRAAASAGTISAFVGILGRSA